MTAIVDNAKRRVGDFLRERIEAGSGLSIVSAYFTIYAYATARADLFRLAELEWLERRCVGRRDNVFCAPPDLAARIRRR